MARPQALLSAIRLGLFALRQEFMQAARRRPSPPLTAAPSRPASPSLRALTAAALSLPGLTPALAAEGDDASFNYGHYTESARELYGSPTQYKPIQVDSLFGTARATLFDRFKFAFNYAQDTWGGATPMATAPFAWGGNKGSANLTTGASPMLDLSATYVDQQLNPYGYEGEGAARKIVKDPRLVHTLSTASPETRQQGDFKLGHEWDDFALEMGGGLSIENDYASHFGNLGGRWDLNQKRTTLNLGLSYTNSATSAQLDPSALTYFNTDTYKDQIERIPLPNTQNAKEILRGIRQDWATYFGVTQVLNKDALVETGFGFTRSTGYLSNPYKTVEFAFVDPQQIPFTDPGAPGVKLLQAQTSAVLEKRPEQRNQWIWDARYVQYVPLLDASLHLGYRFYHDDWGIDAHTFEADWGQPLGWGWTVTPRFRYYSQTAADFYQPYFIYRQAQPTNPTTGGLDGTRLPISQYSSDQRLSGYGALSGGLTLSKRLGRAISLEAGFEYYSHAGNLKLGGGGEGSYADFGYYQWNAGIKVDLSAPLMFADNTHASHAGHHGAHSVPMAPAGVMFAHMLEQSDEVMVGYRYMYNLQHGNMLHGSNNAGDAAIIAHGCGAIQCREAPQDMSMHMHMLDLMYAPTDWLNLMLMPQFLSMEMTLRTLDGAPPPPPSSVHNHTRPTHTTGGIGDTGMYALLKLMDYQGHHVHATLGISAPTGSVNQKMHGTDLIHYGMQLGSGTWDLKPSLTYTGQLDDWSWGAQLNGTKRLEDRNDSGFTFGDIFQSTAWGSYNLFDWLSASMRGIYTLQGSIHGQYNKPHSTTGPMDFPNSYGGHYWDVGFGLSAMVPSGAFQGHHFGIEWLQPVEDHVNGYQQERKGSLSATWHLAF